MLRLKRTQHDCRPNHVLLIRYAARTEYLCLAVLLLNLRYFKITLSLHSDNTHPGISEKSQDIQAGHMRPDPLNIYPSQHL